MHESPFEQFRLWFADASPLGEPLSNAATLATCAAAGAPAARVVLIKSFDERGFVFYTSYQSRKAQDLARNPAAALVFWWGSLERQIRVEGSVARIPEPESDAYFATRPRESQISAWASPQSQEIADREALERLWTDTEIRFANRAIPRPPHWGGLRLAPHYFEFWLGRLGRLHDRFAYRKSDDGSWSMSRLAP